MQAISVSRFVLMIAFVGLAGGSLAPSADVELGRPDVSVDLATREGVELVQGAWRYSDAKIVEVDFKSPGADKKPSGPPNRTYDVTPRAGAADFDDAAWDVIDPTTLDQRRSTGRVCFSWYRLRITIPDHIGSFDPRGSTVVFETVVDDYAEVWVDGQLPRELGQSGGSLVRGFNAPNRLVVARGAQPGQTIQLAVFAMNGPISDPPANFIWMRSAKLDFYGEPHAVQSTGAPRRIDLAIERLDPALDAIVPPGTQLEQIAEGFVFTEGPVWTPGGELLFSDPNRNRIYAWKPTGALSVFREHSGYEGLDIGSYTQPGSNGLAFDAQGRLTICEHGNRRISRIEHDGRVIVLAERHEGRRLNSPNDLVYRSDGALYFSDPPFGLPAFHADPRRELDVTGVYCLKDGKLALVSADLKGPNGLAFSPDERFLYVTNWDEARKVVMRYAVQPDGSLADGATFFDMGAAPQSEALDGVKVDLQGNLFVSGPGGTWILAPDGRHLGTLRGPELAANFAWGDADRRTLFWTARTGVYRMRVATGGRAPARLGAAY